MFKTDLRRGDGKERGSLTSRSQSEDPAAAVAAFQALLNRDDLIGQDVTARFVRVGADGVGRGIYFSDFSRPIGAGRIHPLAPLDPFAEASAARDISAWLPPSPLDVRAELVAAASLVAKMDDDPERHRAAWVRLLACVQHLAR